MNTLQTAASCEQLRRALQNIFKSQYGERSTFVRALEAPTQFAADKANLEIYQGDDYAAFVDVHNADGSEANITGATAKAQIRTKAADSAVLIAAEFTCVVQAPHNVVLSLTHA